MFCKLVIMQHLYETLQTIKKHSTTEEYESDDQRGTKSCGRCPLRRRSLEQLIVAVASGGRLSSSDVNYNFCITTQLFINLAL